MLHSDRVPESKDNTIRLPEDDVSSFAVFAEYLYVGDECNTDAVLEDVCVKGKPGTPGPKKKAQMTRLNMKEEGRSRNTSERYRLPKKRIKTILSSEAAEPSQVSIGVLSSLNVVATNSTKDEPRSLVKSAFRSI